MPSCRTFLVVLLHRICCCWYSFCATEYHCRTARQLAANGCTTNAQQPTFQSPRFGGNCHCCATNVRNCRHRCRCCCPCWTIGICGCCCSHCSAVHLLGLQKEHFILFLVFSHCTKFLDSSLFFFLLKPRNLRKCFCKKLQEKNFWNFFQRIFEILWWVTKLFSKIFLKFAEKNIFSLSLSYKKFPKIFFLENLLGLRNF